MAQFDRRAFVAGVLGAGGVLATRPIGVAVAATDPTKCTSAPIPFRPGMDTRPITERRTVVQLASDSAWQAKIQRGYQKIRDIDQNDPRSWTKQGEIHAIMCRGGVQVHQSTRFVAWHRCFVYFHERIIAYYSTGGTSLDPTFRLPVWNWEGSTTTPSFPTAYTTGSLLDAKRDPRYTRGAGSIDDALATPNVVGRNSFYGYPVGGGGGSPYLENASHANIHVMTGTHPGGGSGPDMGQIPTAAYDPVFFAHHGNVDKVWAWYQGLHNNVTPASTNPATGQPYDPAWAGNTWQFYDYDGKCYSIKAADVIDYRNNLRYSLPPPPRVARAQAFALGASLRATGDAANALKTATATRILLDDVTIPPPGTGLFYVFATIGGARRKIGQFALFMDAMSGPMKASVLVDVDPEAAAKLSSATTFTVESSAAAHRLLNAFSTVPAATGTELRAAAATLLVQ